MRRAGPATPAGRRRGGPGLRRARAGADRLLRTVPVGVALALVLVAAGCTGRTAPTVESEALPPPYTYVAVGAGETVGVGAGNPATESWTSVFHRTALARSATLVNLGARDATVRVALDRELQPALAERPRLVTVWLNVADLVRQGPVEQYEADLTTLVHALRRGGATDVLVAGTPPLADLPAVRACLPGGSACRLPAPLPSADVLAQRLAAFDAAIARVARAEGAVLVDLAAAAAGNASELVAADGLSPSTEGHRRIAAAFATALAALPSSAELRPR